MQIWLDGKLKNMKKYIYLLITVLIAASCDKADVIQETPTDAPFKLSAKITRAESRAVWENQPLNWDGSEHVNSRTYAKPEGDGTQYYHQYWSVGDAISYFKGTQNLMYTSSKTDVNKDEVETHFNPPTVSPGDGYPLSTGYFYGVYPYKEDTKIDTDGTVTFTFPNEQEYCEDSYASGYNGMIGKHTNEDEILEFLNFCSYLQLQITASSDISNKKIDRIILKANDKHDLLSGVGTITYNTSEPEVNMIHELSSNVITLNCKRHNVTLNKSTKFWFVLPGNFTFSTGFHVTVVFTDGSYFNKSTKTHLENGSPYKITIDRNHIKRVQSFEVNELLTAIIRYKYNNPEDNYPSNLYPLNEKIPLFMDKEGNELRYNHFYNEETDEFFINFSSTDGNDPFEGILNSFGANIFSVRYDDIRYIAVDNCNSINLNDFVFYLCSADSIAINNDVTTIGKEAFSRSTIKKIAIDGDVHTIGSRAFTYHKSLESVEIKGQVNVIERSAFNGSTIQSINISERVTNIEAEAFYECSQLTTANIPHVEHIGESAFAGTSLSSIDLSHVHKIGADAFKYCDYLETIRISSKCIQIGEGAFVGCGLMTETGTVNICLYATTPPELVDTNNDGDPFIFSPADNYNIYVPEESVEAYKTAWRWYADKIQAIPTSEDTGA